MNNFKDRLNKLFSRDLIDRYSEYANSECIYWINKFVELKLIPKSLLNKIEIITDLKLLPESASDVMGQFKSRSVNNSIVYQIIVNVGHSIVSQKSWYKIYDSIENFIGNIALHEVCHLVAFIKGAQLRGESDHGETWQKYYKKYRNLYTKVPLEVSSDGKYVNFSNVEFNELFDDCIYELDYTHSDNIKSKV